MTDGERVRKGLLVVVPFMQVFEPMPIECYRRPLFWPLPTPWIEWTPPGEPERRGVVVED